MSALSIAMGILFSYPDGRLHSSFYTLEACEVQGIVPHVPANRSINNQGDGTLFDRSQFHYDEKTDTFRCPANQTLTRKQLSRQDRAVYYAAQPAEHVS
jgi:hypothetical protein